MLEDVGQDLEESLKGDLDDANAQIAALEDELSDQQRFAETVYPALAADTLPGRSLALVVVRQTARTRSARTCWPRSRRPAPR